MADQPPKPGEDAFDVVMMHGATEDGEGAKVLRARPGRLDAGEVRPLKEGRPLAGGGEVVRLEPRAEGKALFDVKVEHVVESKRAANGPAQVATREYRDSWERTFGSGGASTKRDAPN